MKAAQVRQEHTSLLFLLDKFMAVRRDSAAAPLFADLITKIKLRIISKDLWLPARLLVAFQERFSKKKYWTALWHKVNIAPQHKIKKDHACLKIGATKT